MFRKNNLFIARLPGTSANLEKIMEFNFEALANISEKFRKFYGNIKYPENLQP